MKLYRFGALTLVALWVSTVMTAPPTASAQAPTSQAVPTFSKDVAPILYKHCTSCHRPGEIAPMSLLTYAEARPYAKAIRDEIAAGNMPPWHADAPHDTFLNERRLTEAERETLTRWASNGAPEGNPAELPAKPTYTDGWAIGKPDVVLEMAEDYKVPAEGVIEYQ